MIPELVVRADATSAIGTGHLMRCLALAHEWRRRGGAVTVITRTDRPALLARVSASGSRVVRLDARHPDPADLERTVHALGPARAKILVLDNYHFDLEYQQRAMPLARALGVVDDFNHRGRLCADVLINQNVDAPAFVYDVPDGCVQLLGARYAMLRPEFRALPQQARQQPGLARKVLVTLGGADPGNATLLVLRALDAVQRGYPAPLEVRAVIGAANPNRDRLREAAAAMALRVEFILDASDMPGLMSWADVAVAAAGITTWELAYLGVPSVLVVTADNQAGIARRMGELGAAIDGGVMSDATAHDLAEPITRLLLDREVRQSMSRRAQALVDGDGAARVADALLAARRAG